MNSFQLKVPPLAWCLVTMVAMWGCEKCFTGWNFSIPGQQIFALGLTFLGASVALSGVFAFRKAQTTVDPTHPHKASTLVKHGIYRYTRNPMYLGMLFVQLGWFLHLGNPVALIFVVNFVWLMTRLQIIPEERVLVELFREPYEQYLLETPRWFLFV